MTENRDLQRRPIYSGKIVDLGLETAELPNGVSVELEIIKHPGGAATVAVDAQGQVCLLRQYRHAAGGWLWELPAGKLDPGETSFGTARRELAEEAGVEAENWTDLGPMHSSPGVLTEVIHLYLASGLRQAVLDHGSHEIIEIHWIPLGRALSWCIDGTITDAKTLIGLFRAQTRFERSDRFDLGSSKC